MADADNIIPGLDVDESIRYTMLLRKDLLGKLTENVDSLLKDKDGLSATIALMRDMDSSSLKIKRLATDNKANDNTAESLALIRNVMSLVTKDPFARPIDSDKIPDEDTDVSKLPEIDILPGETSVGVESHSYQEFMEKHSNNKSR